MVLERKNVLDYNTTCFSTYTFCAGEHVGSRSIKLVPPPCGRILKEKSEVGADASISHRAPHSLVELRRPRRRLASSDLEWSILDQWASLVEDRKCGLAHLYRYFAMYTYKSIDDLQSLRIHT